MPFIFIDPDELQTGRKFPDNIPTFPCPGLEARTGADFIISKLPIDDIDFHLKNKSLFVQRKTGYDIFSFDQTRSELARMKACGIGMQQAFLLFIGRCYPDETGAAIINHTLQHGDRKVPYKTFEEIQMYAEGRGVKFRQIPSDNELPVWIEAQFTAIEKMEDEGCKEFYTKEKAYWNDPDDIWQELVEVHKDDWRHTLVAGLEGFGPKLALSVHEYLVQNPSLYPTLFNALLVLTQLDDQGKQVHSIKGWGIKSCYKLRSQLGLLNSYDLPKDNRPKEPFVQNLFAAFTTDEDDPSVAFWRGANAAIDTVADVAKAGVVNGKQLIEVSRKCVNQMIVYTPEILREMANGKS